eukprot:SAG31_NODE_5354_length_2592_cov_1.825913_2_plen_162_part_00
MSKTGVFVGLGIFSRSAKLAIWVDFLSFSSVSESPTNPAFLLLPIGSRSTLCTAVTGGVHPDTAVTPSTRDTVQLAGSPEIRHQDRVSAGLSSALPWWPAPRPFAGMLLLRLRLSLLLLLAHALQLESAPAAARRGLELVQVRGGASAADRCFASLRSRRR